MKMESSVNAIVVMTTTENQVQAELIAHTLVENRLAACVQILPSMISVYQWQGKLEKSTENLLLIKTLAENYTEIEKTIKAHHPYDIPEIISLPIQSGSPGYLVWLAFAVKK